MTRWRVAQHEVPIQATTKSNYEVLRDVTMDREGLHTEAEVGAEMLPNHARGDHRPLTTNDHDQRVGEVLLGCLQLRKVRDDDYLRETSFHQWRARH